MIIVNKQGDIKEYGKPIKETDHKLFFQLGSVCKHSINFFHKKQTLNNFRKFVAEKEFDKATFKSLKIH